MLENGVWASPALISYKGSRNRALARLDFLCDLRNRAKNFFAAYGGGGCFDESNYGRDEWCWWVLLDRTEGGPSS